ncbi:MAG TPA: asparaginase, partial [Candidatus Kapabacteria bacterium]|nr:asparaginase [Candidatus Kapabacteria bacterium]
MNNLPKIAIVFTGGTIAMKIDPATGGAVPALSGEQVVALVPELAGIAEISVHNFGRYPGPHMTPRLMLDLKNYIRAIYDRDHVDGVVITHGTDTLEETAYFLDLTLNLPVAAVLTGAMNNASEANWDGPKNLLDSVRVAADIRFRGAGVLVCLAGEINAASEVSKTHTDEIGTFHSFDFGPLAKIENGSIQLIGTPHHRDVIE